MLFLHQSLEQTRTPQLKALVQEISSIIPRSKIDTMQTPEPADSNLQVETENDLYENPQPEGYGPDSTHQNDGKAERREFEEECLREETLLIEKIERVRNRVNSDGELRGTMRPRSGPADLRNPRLNRDKDARELMRPRPGPSDLRYSNLQPNKELREVMKPKPLRCTEKQRNEDISLSDAYDSSTEEGEVESSEDELPSEDKLPSEDELTNVLYSENKNTVSTPIPGPSRARSDQTKVPGPPTKSKPQEEKPTKKKPSPIKYPGANEWIYSGDDVPLNRLTTPKRSRSLSKIDLRKKLAKVPVFSEPKLHNDKGPLQSRITWDLPGPWMMGRAPKCGTEHRHRPFIASSEHA